MGNLALLTSLSLGENGFDGPVTSALQNLTQIQYLVLSWNGLSGPIPLFVCDYKNITGLFFGRNKMTGTLPECLGELALLQNLGVEYNSFSGGLPTSLALLPQLITLWIDNNRLSGALPNLVIQPSITQLLLYDNQFTSTIPDIFGNTPQLQYFAAGSNFLSGTIPASIGIPIRNTVIDVSENLLSGSIPTSISRVRDMFQLLLHDNFLEGSLGGVFNASTQIVLDSVLVQQNQLTGALPDELFRLTRLNTFIAIENCFSGTLTESICNAKDLVSLILDGLHSGKACRNPLLPATHTYGVSNSFYGTIPACLLELRTLTSLHLSGNSLTGTLPSDVNISSHLLDLTVSHNSLTGTVPQVVQLHNWRNLDLSYNRLSGSLRNDFASAVGPTKERLQNATFNSTDHAINIQNNRISGSSPRSIVHMQNVSSLGSNMFACKVDKSDLPQYDGDRENYQCASDAFDGPYYVFIGLGGVALLALCAQRRYSHSAVVAMETSIRKWMDEVETAPRNIAYVSAASDIMCQLAVWCTGAVVVVLVPWYATASHYFGTYTHQYAWVVSAGFLSGFRPTIANLILYCALMVGLLCGAAIIVVRKDRMERHRSSSRSSARLEKPGDVPAMPGWKRYLVYITFLSFNLVIVVPAWSQCRCFWACLIISPFPAWLWRC
jgi:Leucine-rich repeat (LRR) protein